MEKKFQGAGDRLHKRSSREKQREYQASEENGSHANTPDSQGREGYRSRASTPASQGSEGNRSRGTSPNFEDGRFEEDGQFSDVDGSMDSNLDD